jgi:hypothetical protein
MLLYKNRGSQLKMDICNQKMDIFNHKMDLYDQEVEG